MGQSKSKRQPKNFNEYTEKLNPKYVQIHTQALKELIETETVRCKSMDVISNANEMNDLSKNWNSAQNQFRIECSVKKALRNLETSKDGLKIGDLSLQKIFTPLKTLSSGSFGVALSSGFKGSKPFAIIKATVGPKQTYQKNVLLHEIIVGLLLNQLREITPCFTYCYGGFYCSPPLDIEKHWKAWETEEENDDLFNVFFQYVKDILPDQDYEKYKEYFFDINYPSENFIKEYTIFLKEFSDKNENDSIKKDLQNQISLIEDNYNRIISVKDIYSYKKPQINYDLLCKNTKDDEISSLCIFEFVPDAINIGDFLQNCSHKEFLQVMILVYSSLYIAYKKFKFIHYDLHGDNILIRTLPRAIDINIRIDQKRIVKVTTKYVPQIIDYGLSVAAYNNQVLNSLVNYGQLWDEIIDDHFFDSLDMFYEKLDVNNKVSLPKEINNLSKDIEEWMNQVYKLSKQI
jgi:hypothetical protein